MKFFELPRKHVGVTETMITTELDEYHIIILESKLTRRIVVTVLAENEQSTLVQTIKDNYHSYEFHFDMNDDILIDIGRAIVISIAPTKLS